MIGPGNAGEAAAINQVLQDVFNAGTGALAEYAAVADAPGELSQLIDAGDPPDLAVMPNAAAVVAAAEDGQLVALEDLGIDVDQLAIDYPSRFAEQTEYEGKHYGVPIRPAVKSLVWYHLPTFEAGGYDIPTTWDGLIALSEQMVADGLTPWCLGLESQGFSGWPATDWVEDLLLRTQGGDTYDAWVAHEIDFDDPVVADAVARFGEIAFGDGFVLGGSQAAASRPFYESVQLLAEGQCVMERQGDFILELDAGSFEVGTDVGVFGLPPIEHNAALVAPQFVTAAQNRPETAAFLDWFVGAEAQCEMGVVAVNPYTSLHRQVGPECFSLPSAVVAKEVLEAADPVDGIRDDGSDLMPSVIGGDGGAFLQAMLDYLNEGSGVLVGVLGEVEAAWP